MLIEIIGVIIVLMAIRALITKNRAEKLLYINVIDFGISAIIERLGVETIRANSSEAKGRIERYNGTCQNRLPNDIKRFGIKDYDELNIWFNSFYKHYLNRKFANIALDPINEF